uniref:Zinc finger CCHC domain-containing protein 7 n=1 Tax=Pectinophora gossypiella TaxID=13191 RepID=A0A1E1VZ97_PECGO
MKMTFLYKILLLKQNLMHMKRAPVMVKEKSQRVLCPQLFLQSQMNSSVGIVLHSTFPPIAQINTALISAFMDLMFLEAHLLKTRKGKETKKVQHLLQQLLKNHKRNQPLKNALPHLRAKQKNRKEKEKSYVVTEKSLPSADVYDSDSNQSIVSVVESNKNRKSYIVSEKSLPSVDVYETDSNPSETPRATDISKPSLTSNIESSDSSTSLDKTQEETAKSIRKETVSNNDPVTIDLTENYFVEEDIVVANVSGFTESEDYGDETVQEKAAPKFGSTKVPAILYENLDFDNLKGKEKVCKNRRYSLTTLRAEMEKFYNESWGGEDFNHREIQKNMSRDKSLWAIDPKDKMPSLNRKKYNVMCNYCNRPGHRDDTCRLKPPVCFMCGNTGHMEPRCPSKICVNCGSANHMYSTMCRNCVNWSRITCAECGQNGHPSSHCPDMWRRYHNTIDVTPILEENRFTKKHYQLFCSGCTRRGHLVHTCRLSLPFSGLPINSPFVNMYRPIYAPVSDTNTPDQSYNNQKNKRSFKTFQQESTISSAAITPSRPEHGKRQSKSPTVHETHTNKKRNMCISENTEAQASKSPVRPDHQRKTSQSKEPSENIEEAKERECVTANVPVTEAAPDFIPISSWSTSNHDKKGHVIQDNEVSDTSDVVTSARIYVTSQIIDKLKSTEGEGWLKQMKEKFHVTVENADSNSFLSIKGKVRDQEAFQSAFREWVTEKPSTNADDRDISHQTEGDRSFFSNNIPKNRKNVLRKLAKAFKSLKVDLGEPNELFKELNYLKKNHQQLLKQKVINPKQLNNNRDRINLMVKKLNMILVGQAGLAGGFRHLKELQTLQEKLINIQQKTISLDLREEIGEHFQTIFTAAPRHDYVELLNSYNFKPPLLHQYRKLSLNKCKMKKFITIPFTQKKNQRSIKEAKVSIEKSKPEIISCQSPVRKPLVEKTKNKLVFFKNRLMNARPNDTVHRKTRNELVQKLQSYIGSLSNDVNMSSKSIKKMRRVQEQAQLFLNNA